MTDLYHIFCKFQCCFPYSGIQQKDTCSPHKLRNNSKGASAKLKADVKDNVTCSWRGVPFCKGRFQPLSLVTQRQEPNGFGVKMRNGIVPKYVEMTQNIRTFLCPLYLCLYRQNCAKPFSSVTNTENFTEGMPKDWQVSTSNSGLAYQRLASIFGTKKKKVFSLFFKGLPPDVHSHTRQLQRKQRDADLYLHERQECNMRWYIHTWRKKNKKTGDYGAD